MSCGTQVKFFIIGFLRFLKKNVVFSEVNLTYVKLSCTSPDGHVVGRVEAIDNDRQGSIKYFILGGNDENKFRIEPETGDILVTGSLDREEKDWYRLVVEARDDTVPQYRDTAFVSRHIGVRFKQGRGYMTP